MKKKKRDSRPFYIAARACCTRVIESDNRERLRQGLWFLNCRFCRLLAGRKSLKSLLDNFLDFLLFQSVKYLRLFLIFSVILIYSI